MRPQKTKLFTYQYIEEQYRQTINFGYEFITCKEYVKRKKTLQNEKIVVNRVDIDFSVKKCARLLAIFKKLNIKATFFIRMHAREYNPFSFENYRILREIVRSGHELAYHSEIMDASMIWGEDPEDILLRDLSLLSTAFNVKISGIASHGGATGINNLDFWSNRIAQDYGLDYEAYDATNEFGLFNSSLYVSDSEWTQWKSYQNGKLLKNDRSSLAEHARDGHSIIYLLIHPDTYFDLHIYENEN